MKIEDIPEFHDKKEVLCFEAKDSVLEAVKAMDEMNYGAVVVTQAKKVVGIFSERDLMRRVVAKGKDVKKLKLKDVMTTNVKTASTDEYLTDCMRRMSQGRFRHLPIVNTKGHLIGLLSQGDFVSYTWGQLLHHLKQSTKSSFLTYTQIWMLLIATLTYITLMVILATW